MKASIRKISVVSVVLFFPFGNVDQMLVTADDYLSQESATTNDDSDKQQSKGATKESASDDHFDEYSPTESCELFLAESTIPNAGLGIFTGKLLEVGDPVGHGDVAIPIVDVSWHMGETDTSSLYETYFDPFKDYVWHGSYLGMGQESDSEDIGGFWPGINAAVNFYPVLVNLSPTLPDYDEAGVHRSLSPGAGAFSPYHNGTGHASRRIPSGGELFKSYGDYWYVNFPLSLKHSLLIAFHPHLLSLFVEWKVNR